MSVLVFSNYLNNFNVSWRIHSLVGLIGLRLIGLRYLVWSETKRVRLTVLRQGKGAGGQMCQILRDFMDDP